MIDLDAVTIRDQMCHFLEDVLSSRGPFDRIIPVERKGTAAFRVFLSRRWRRGLPSGWNGVLSSNAIPLVSDHDIHGQRILVFEEMTRTGRHIRRALAELSKINVDISQQVVVAAFAAGSELNGDSSKFCAYYKRLTPGQYQTVRMRFIDMLQNEGSLLLDTEHPEIVVRIQCTIADFLSALATCGQITKFESGGRWLNVTVCEPGLSPAGVERLTRYLPEGACLNGVVKKVRVVQRAPNLFAVIPIYYPEVPEKVEAGWSEYIPEFVRGDTQQPIGRFYTVGLLAAVELLGPLWSCLKARLKKKVTAFVGETPSGDDIGDRASGSLEHLRALLPNLDVDGLRRHVVMILQEAEQLPPERTRGTRHRRLSHEQAPNARSLQTVALRLAQHVLDESESRAASASEEPEDVVGLTYAEVAGFVERMRAGLPHSAVSAALDLLIDHGCIVTRVERRTGPLRHLRTFHIDGEIVASRLRNFTAVHGFQEVEWP